MGDEYKIYIDKMMEITGDINDTQDSGAKLYIGDYAVYDISTDLALARSQAKLQYLYRDRLGSVVAIADSNGDLVETAGRGFDPFGKSREDDWSDSDHRNNGLNDLGDTASLPGDLNRDDLTTRGFTGHEHLNETDLIHMNGRVYDYNLGRFYSVDPFIQFPENSQSVNGYSYILNNPLSGTDPSGYAVNPVAQECQAGVGTCRDASTADSGVASRLLGQSNRAGVLYRALIDNGAIENATIKGDKGAPEEQGEESNRENVNGDDQKGNGDGTDDKELEKIKNGLKDRFNRFLGHQNSNTASFDYSQAAEILDEYGVYAGAGLVTRIINSSDLNDVSNIWDLRRAVDDYFWGDYGVLYKYNAIGLSGSVSFSAEALRLSAGVLPFVGRRLFRVSRGHVGDAELALQQYLPTLSAKARKAAGAVGVVDVKTGRTLAGTSGPVSSKVHPVLQRMADKLGGLGVKTACGNTLGACAEFRVANQMLFSGSRFKDLRFSGAVRTRTGEPLSRCQYCTDIFGRE